MSLSNEEFERLALAELDPLYRMARRLTRDGNRADDLVQETYARALRSRDSFSLASTVSSRGCCASCTTFI
jgi:RNA polymerase sigma-70 factor (ECF subfamily)